MKKPLLGLGSLSIVALSPINIVSCSEVSMSEKVKKELGYIDSNGKAKADNDTLVKTDKVTVKIAIKDLTSAQPLTINDIVIA